MKEIRCAPLGPLDAIRIDAGKDAPVLVLFHGYGADAADIAGMAGELELPRPVTMIFPEGPLRLDMGGMSGRAWFPIDEEDVARAQEEGRSIDWSGRVPKGFDEARKTVLDFLKALGVPLNRLILGGFSQGAMLATDIALRAPEAPLGLAILSGTLINEKEWRELAVQRSGLPFFQSHGIADPILGYQSALRLSEILKAGGLKGEFRAFEGGHNVPPEIAQALSRFIGSLV